MHVPLLNPYIFPLPLKLAACVWLLRKFDNLVMASIEFHTNVHVCAWKETKTTLACLHTAHTYMQSFKQLIGTPGLS